MFVDREAGEEAWKQSKADLGQAASGASGHFVYDRDQMHAIGKLWEELGRSYAKSINDSRAMTGVIGPGEEYASKSHALDANRSGEAYHTSLNDCSEYCYQQAAKYRKALGEVVEADEEGHKKLQQPSTPLDGGL